MLSVAVTLRTNHDMLFPSFSLTLTDVHGISSVSGLRFTPPTHLRCFSDAAGTTEGKCHQCDQWILICTAKRKRSFAAWYKHAHQCHSYRKASAIATNVNVNVNEPLSKKRRLS